MEPLLYPEIITRAMILMTPPDERRHRNFEVPINPGPALKRLLPVLEWLSDPDNYNATFFQQANSHKSHKSLERAFLWEPLLHLMKKHGVKPGQYGSFSRAIKSLHFALGIDPPNEVAVRGTVHDMKHGQTPEEAQALSEQQKHRIAQP